MNSHLADGRLMRAVTVAVLAVLFVAASLPAEAHPLPKTEKAVREVVKDTLAEVDQDGADLLIMAHKLVKEARKATGIGEIPVPGLPSAPSNGRIEIRASLAQPGIQGQDETISILWLGSAGEPWTGAYWVETTESAGVVIPSLMEIDEVGLLLFLDGGAQTNATSLTATYHFLGLDGRYTKHVISNIPLLASVPVLDHVEVGGAHASQRGKEPEAILLTPWNTMDRNVTMGITLLAGNSVLYEETVAGCEDWQASETEPGCRLLYVMPLTSALTRVQVWHLEPDGRVVDRELSRAVLEGGFTFSA